MKALKINKVTTSNHRSITGIGLEDSYIRGRQWTILEAAPTEIDNHADTICFGQNFRPISFTSAVATVSPFLVEYESQMDIPIVTAATAYDNEKGETLILMFGQGLWFGD